MARPGITYHDVTDAIQTLLGQNKPVTIENIRQQLKTGSNSTIARYLNDWKKQSSGSLLQPHTLPKEIVAFVEGLWQRVQEEMMQKVLQHQEDIDTKLLTAQQELRASHQTIITLKDKLHQAEEQLSIYQHREKENQLVLATEQKNNAKLTERVQLLETQNSKEANEKKELHYLLKQTQANLEHYQQAALELREKQQLTLEQERQTYQKNIDALQQAFIQESQQKIQFENQCKQIEKYNQKLTKEADEHREMLKQSQSASRDLEIKLQAKHQQHQQLEAQYQTVIDRSKRNEEALINLKAELMATSNQHKMYEQELAKAKDKIQALRQDNLFLTEEKFKLAGQFEQLQTMIA
jgi:chromosome segregation ATPase